MKQTILLFFVLIGVIPATQAQNRDPLKWPFSKTSIWNMPIHNNATYVPAAIQPANNFEADEDIIVLTPHEPLLDIKINRTDWNSTAAPNARCADQGIGTLFSAPIPQNFIYTSPDNTVYPNNRWHGVTPNAGLAVLYPNGKIKQTQPFAKCSPGIATSHYVIGDENNCILKGECIEGAHGGSKLSAIGGALRVGELTAGEIKHVLKINLWGRENFYGGNGGKRWPAPGVDTGYDDINSGNYYGGTNAEMRIGALLALHKDVILESVLNNSLGLETEAALIIARALRNYGAYTVDNTAWDAYAIITEHGPNGRVSDEFKNLYGFDMNVYNDLNATAWGRDIKKLFANLNVISNNTEGNTGGGSVTDLDSRLAPPAPDFLPAQTFRIMPLGDSKTEGGGGNGQQSSWRGFLRSKLVNAGYKIDYVGDRQNATDGDATPPDYDHAGHGGYTIGPDINRFCPTCETTGLFEHIQQWIPAANPDVILLAIGVNDMFNEASHPANYKATAPQRYQDLVNKILQLRPGVKLILGSVEPVKWDKFWGSDPNDGSLGALNAKIKAIADASATDNIFFADIYNRMFSTWTPSDFWDDLHLNQQGATKNANIWFDTLVPVLNNTPENVAPTCSITSPINNATYNAPASITIEATATDTEGNLSKVEFYQGTIKIGEDATAPYSFTWSNVEEGTYVVTAVAIDALFASGSSAPDTIIVNSTDGYIKFTGTGIGSPGSYENSGLTFEKALDGDIHSFFNAPAADGQWVGIDLGAAKTVKKVRYAPRSGWTQRLVNGKIQGSNSPDFAGAVDLFVITSAPTEGFYTTARFNNSQLFQFYRFLSPNQGYGNISEIEFWGDANAPINQAPACTLITPTPNSAYGPGSNISLKATASDTDGTITKVDFYNGTTLIGTSATAPYNFVWAKVPAGIYHVTAKATDNVGITKISLPAKITVSTQGSDALYAENFDANTSAGWTANGGTWVAENQRWNNTNTNGVFTSFYNGNTFSNYTYSLDATPVWGNNIGFIFNYQDAGNYYLLEINGNTKNTAITKMQDYSASVITHGTFIGNGFNTNHQISIKNDAATTTVSINGATVFNNVPTTDFASGKIGLYAFYCPAYFDNILVTSNNKFPAVSITTPAYHTTLTEPANIVVTASATDADGTVGNVAFYSDASLIGNSSTAPYTATLTNAPAGVYNFTAKATDNKGSSITSSAVKVIVNPSGSVAPVVGITSPAAHSSFAGPATIQIAASASDADGSISKVEFYNEAQLLATATASPYTITWSGVAAGTYRLTALAYDITNVVTSSAPVTIIVTNEAPVVSITSPTNNQTYTAPANVGIIASASDGDGTIARVDFYNGTAKLGSTVSPYTFNWSNLSTGSYSIMAIAYDNAGDSTVSSPVNITVNAPVKSIPGRVQAENYDAQSGVQTEDTSDAGGGLNIGYLDANDWMDYTVTVASAGVYTFNYRVAAAVDNSTLRLMNASTVLHNVNVPNTGGWQTWTTIAATATLPAGTSTLRLTTATGGFNLNWFEGISVNPVLNFSFEADNAATQTPLHWNEWNDVSAAYTEIGGGSTEGLYHLTHWSANSYEVSNYQAITGLANGTYRLSAFTQASGGQTSCQVIARGFGGADKVINVPANTSWTKVSVGNIVVTNSQCEIHIYSKANAGNWAVFDEITLTPEGVVEPDRTEDGGTLTVRSENIPNEAKGNLIDNNASSKWLDFSSSSWIQYQFASAKSYAINKYTITSANDAPERDPATFTLSGSNNGSTWVVIDSKTAQTWNGRGVTNEYTLNNTTGYLYYRFDVNAQSGTIMQIAEIELFGPEAPISLPSVSVTSPANNSSYIASSNITIGVSASSAGATISSIELYAGTTLLTTLTASPYEFNWTNVAAGTYTLTAKAIDNAGATKISEEVVIVVNPNPVPVVSITSPTNNTDFLVNSSANIEASATDDGTITRVEFFSGSMLLGTDTVSPYAFNWTNIPVGTYTLTAKATDNLGASTTSETVVIHVKTNLPPVVSITSPVNNDVFTATVSVNITASASDNGGVSKVEFYNGTTLLSTDRTAPYSYNWKNVSPGTYSLTAKATDNVGATTTSEIVAFVVNPNPPPVVSITSPVNNDVFTATVSVNITASASDNGGVSKVEFYNGTTLLSTDRTAPYSYNWTNVPPGSYSLTAKATDNFGATTTSEIVAFVVNPNPPPVVSITSPVNNDVFTATVSVNITASASDNGGVSKVEFYNGTTLLSTDRTAPYSYNWVSVPPGSYSLTAKATDNFGATTTSEIVAFVVNPNPPPVVSITSPTNNAVFTANTAVTITAIASDNGGVSKVEFFNGTTLLGTDRSSPYSYRWANVAAGMYTLSAKATDNFGATATSSIVIVVNSVASQSASARTASDSGTLVEEVERGLSAYPNPIANEDLTIVLNGYEGETSIEIRDINSKVVFKERTTSNELKVSRDNFASGIYILMVSSREKTATQKIMVK
jgi:lysophospholipase L1-like esterase